ncbi:hypothetical protein [Dietzia maris]|uniref:HNH endonuclease n=1 Tax=Dietzia maris TaxID=37915 RepID=A0ABT8GYM3_9ACTN|nr:hypothetical protein [Dietzia maris]MCZ4539850.1 hypothetical protein [Dietzia maris]MDN4505310.1 hypothetical protein [Dietzia maris]
MTSSTRPEPGTRAAGVHDTVHQLRAAVAGDHPGRALRIARGLSDDQARAALIVAIISANWTPEERAAMKATLPDRPDDEPDQRRHLRRRRRTAPIAETFSIDWQEKP